MGGQQQFSWGKRGAPMGVGEAQGSGSPWEGCRGKCTFSEGPRVGRAGPAEGAKATSPPSLLLALYQHSA